MQKMNIQAALEQLKRNRVKLKELYKPAGAYTAAERQTLARLGAPPEYIARQERNRIQQQATPKDARVTKASDSQVVYKASKITGDEVKRATDLADTAANHGISDRNLAKLIEIYGFDETERFILIATGAIEKALKSRTPADNFWGALGARQSPQQLLQGVVQKAIDAGSTRDGFWGGLNVQKSATVKKSLSDNDRGKLLDDALTPLLKALKNR